MISRLHRAAVLGLALTALAAAGARAADPAAAPATMARPAKGFVWLDAAAFDPARVLPAPPAEGDERMKAELAQTERAYRIDDAGRKALAQWDNDHENASLFAPALGLAFDMERLPATSALLELVQHEASAASGPAKKKFKRIRPWAEDRTITPCDAGESDNPATSYPSGHATIGWALAGVLVELMPQKASVIEDRASDFAYSRLVCGDHYPSDLEAGHVIGALVAARLLADPRLKPQIEAARAELIAAGLTPAS